MDINILEIVEMKNEKNMSLRQIAEYFSTSKSTISRRLKDNNYKLVNEKYVLHEEISDNNKDIVSSSYSIPLDVHKALRVMSTMEDKDISDVIFDALKSYIPQKYYL